ncbi:uncharacterized protein LOC106720248 [Papilio machaon]|uniref:uncharacterized protein LOC106720248 n=1 Tax=Papilio machaon TaxID=76193 RepID=UPI001E665E40|nr:uncharacterized protein LOC106720248 [Papilio machaon]
MIKYIVFLAIVTATSGRPKDKTPWNMVTVPTNCPKGQQLINGECRDIWSQDDILKMPMEVENEQNGPRNMITVPTNCPPGQELINGVCRDIWLFRPTSPIPTNIEDSLLHMENAPLNMITVPTNCPPGQQLINGVCRDVWMFAPTRPTPLALEQYNESKIVEKIIESIKSELLYRQKRQLDLDAEEILQLLDEANVSRNIIAVPNQCPAGYRPDIFGICRPIFD